MSSETQQRSSNGPGELLLDRAGERLIVTDDRQVSPWSVETRATLTTAMDVRRTHLAPGGRAFATEEVNRARLWRTSTGEVVHEVTCRCRIVDTVFSSDGG